MAVYINTFNAKIGKDLYFWYFINHKKPHVIWLQSNKTLPSIHDHYNIKSNLLAINLQKLQLNFASLIQLEITQDTYAFTGNCESYLGLHLSNPIIEPQVADHTI